MEEEEEDSPPVIPIQQQEAMPDETEQQHRQHQDGEQQEQYSQGGFGEDTDNGPTPPSSDLFASLPPIDPSDPFGTPVRSSGAHKHFSNSAAPSEEEEGAGAGERDGNDGDGDGLPVSSLSGFINAFDDDRDEEEIEMDAKLANLKRLCDFAKGGTDQPSTSDE